MECMARAVAICILKGGFGKSTVAINTTRELAERNGHALLVDLDDNGHATFNLGYKNEFRNGNHVKEILIDGADPREHTVEVSGGMDLLPSHQKIEEVQDSLKSAMGGSQRLKEKVVDPLLDDGIYDYVVVDTPANRGKMNENAMFATRNLIMPIRPEAGWESGINQTTRHVIREANEYFNLDLLALAPTDLSERLDQDRRDRRLLKKINSRDDLVGFVPSFARVNDAEWNEIDAGEFSGELPGIRSRSAIDDAHRAQMPLRDYDPECDQLESFDELAQIVENGGVA